MADAAYQREWRLRNIERTRKTERDYKWRNIEKVRERGRQNYHQLRSAMIDAYGGKCACCGESEKAFLTLDHIFEDGAEERRRIHGGGRASSPKFYRLLRDLGWPKDRYQLLCYNCNSAKHHGGCPHQLQ